MSFWCTLWSLPPRHTLPRRSLFSRQTPKATRVDALIYSAVRELNSPWRVLLRSPIIQPSITGRDCPSPIFDARPYPCTYNRAPRHTPEAHHVLLEPPADQGCAPTHPVRILYLLCRSTRATITTQSGTLLPQTRQHISRSIQTSTPPAYQRAARASKICLTELLQRARHD